jgi:hypothetical protein
VLGDHEPLRVLGVAAYAVGFILISLAVAALDTCLSGNDGMAT